MLTCSYKALEQLNPDNPCYLPPVDDDDQPTNGVIAGMMSWVDASFHFHQDTRNHSRGGREKDRRVVFQTNRSLFLQDVYVHGAQDIAVFPNATLPASPPASPEWTVVRAFGHGVNPDAYSSTPHYQLVASTFLNGKRTVPAGKEKKWARWQAVTYDFTDSY